MRFNYVYVTLFFVLVAALGALLFPTYFDVATIHRNSFLYSTALGILDDIDRSSDEPRVDLERARVLYLVGRYDDALTVLEALTKQRPQHVGAWRQLAETYRTVQRPLDAMASLERLLAVAPADSQALYLVDEYYRWFQHTDRALANLQRIVEEFPEDFASHERLVDLYLRTGDGERAAALLQRMSGVFAEADESLGDLAALHLAQGDARAVEVYERLHERQPERTDLLDGLVAALIMAGRAADAMQRFDGNYEPRLAPPAFAARRARLQLVIGDQGGAIASFEVAESLDETLDFSRDLAELYAAAGDYVAAADRVARIVRRQPAQRANWELHVAYLATAGLRAELIAALEASLLRWPDDEALLRELADAYQWVEDYEAEGRVLKQLVGRRPEDPELLARLATNRAGADDAEGAVAAYDGLFRRARSAWSADHLDGLLLAAQGVPTSRRPCALLAAARSFLDPSRAGSALSLAAQLEACQRPDLAASVYDGLAATHARDATVLAQLGQQLAEEGYVAQAETRFVQALGHDRDHPTALSGLAAVRAGEDPLAAAGLLRRLQRLRPRDGDVAYRLGLALEAARDTTAMLAAYGESLRWLPATDLSEYGVRQRAHALASTGDAAAALDLLTAAIERQPGAHELANDAAEILLSQGQAAEALRWLARVPEL